MDTEKRCYQIDVEQSYCFNRAGGKPCIQTGCAVYDFIEKKKNREWQNLYDGMTVDDFATSFVCPSPISDISLNDPLGEWTSRTQSDHIDPGRYWVDIFAIVTR